MSKFNNYKEKPNSRKSINYYIQNRNNSDLETSFYAYMLVEDLHLGIMPIIRRAENSSFKVELNPPSEEIENLIKLSLHTHHTEPWDIEEALCDFIDEAAQIIAYYGKAYYEIVYFYTNNKKSKIESFNIERIHNDNIKDMFGIYWQFIPKTILKERKELQKRLKFLPREDLLVLSIPKTLGGIKNYRNLINKLKWAENVIPEFAIKDMEMQKQEKGYDFLIYEENQENFVAKITSILGWPARLKFSNRSLEFYQLYRYLKFEKSKAILREYILKKINECLLAIGKKIGFKTEVIMTGIPFSKDYDNYIKQLLEGSLQFNDVIRITRF